MAIVKTYKCRFCGEEFEGALDLHDHLYRHRVKLSPTPLHMMQIELICRFNGAYMCDEQYPKMKFSFFKRPAFFDDSGNMRIYSKGVLESKLKENEDISEKELDSCMELVGDDKKNGVSWEVFNPKYYGWNEVMIVKANELSAHMKELLEMRKQYKPNEGSLFFRVHFTDWDDVKKRLGELQNAMPVEWLHDQIARETSGTGKVIQYIVEQAPVLQDVIKARLSLKEVQDALKRNFTLERAQSHRLYSTYKMQNVPEGMDDRFDILIRSDRRD